MEYTEDAVIRTPLGLPGFESETGFLLIQLPGQYPLVYLQSLQSPDLCFPALPVRVADADYQLEVNDEDSGVLGVSTRPGIGSDVLCLALLAAEETGTATANLKAPLVVRIGTRIGVQCLNSAGDYLCRHPLEEGVPA
ncbi:MAG: flagellar assembly protein FliW [Bryobacteraceae bacterium]|nr:flagellar assembly protein FliW [Bryobacteraceae bacterium]